MHAPMLLEDGSSLDWPNATYTPIVGIGTRTARIQHSVNGADLISELVSKGDAVWAVELRCPKTLMARTTTSPVADHTIRWEEADIEGPAWLIPGVLATTELPFPDTNVLHEVWRDASPVFPSGYWIVRGDARRVTPFRDSLMSFHLDPELPLGRMHVETDHSSGDLRFAVRAASDVYREATEGEGNRSVWIAALIGVCGHFGRVFRSADDGEDGQALEADFLVEDGDDPMSGALAEEIQMRLDEAGVPSWDDPDLYDPAAAALLLSPSCSQRAPRTMRAMREQLLDQTARPFSAWQESLAVRPSDLSTEEDRERHASRQRVLRAALDSGADGTAAYLRDRLAILGDGAIGAPTFPRERLTPSEFREPPAELEIEIAEAWQMSLSPALASRPLFWLLCHVAWLEEGRFGPDGMHAFFCDGARDTLDGRTRMFMRRSGGLPHVRGNVSVFSDCPLARAWWRVRIATEAASDPEAGLSLGDAHATLRSNAQAWERFALLGLRQITVISQPRARAALIAALTEHGVFDVPTVLRTGRALARVGTMRSLAHIPWSEIYGIAEQAANETGTPA